MRYFAYLIISLVIIACSYATHASSSSQSEQARTPNVLDAKVIDLGGDNERIRPKDALQFRFGNTNVTFTGAASLIDFDYGNNFDLRSTESEDEFNFRPRVDFNTIFDFSNNFYLFTELRLRDTTELRHNKKTQNDFELQVRDLFLNIPLSAIGPIDLRIGRQQLFDKRRWLLNDRLDGIRLLSNMGAFHLSTAFTTPVPDTQDSFQLFDNFFQKRRQTDVIINLDYSLAPKTILGSYVIIGNEHVNRIKEERPRNEDPVWIGFRVMGDKRFRIAKPRSKFLRRLFRQRIQYWLDAAYVTGSTGSKRISGYGLDIGATTIARKLPLRPYITMKYAFGSGDSNDEDGVDHNFRQTGFQNNQGRFGGVVNFDYYGVLLQPELSNMHILTAIAGFRPLKKTSFEIVYHRYIQNHAFGKLSSNALNANPDGAKTHLGDEFDVVLGYRGFENVRIRSRTGYFIPGAAFVNQDAAAFFTRLDVQFIF